MQPSRARLAALAAAFLGYGVSAYSQNLSQDQIENFRKQFQYGRSLVTVCRYTVHDIGRSIDCRSHALFPSRDTEVSNAVIAGADYQMMVMEQEAGQQSLFKTAVSVRSAVEKMFKGNAAAYCAFGNVDCGPVQTAIADWEKALKGEHPSQKQKP